MVKPTLRDAADEINKQQDDIRKRKPLLRRRAMRVLNRTFASIQAAKKRNVGCQSCEGIDLVARYDDARAALIRLDAWEGYCAANKCDTYHSGFDLFA